MMGVSREWMSIYVAFEENQRCSGRRRACDVSPRVDAARFSARRRSLLRRQWCSMKASSPFSSLAYYSRCILSAWPACRPSLLSVVRRRAVTKILLLCYLPLFLWPASTAYPGWKGFEAMWKWFDYTATCTKYFGTFSCQFKTKIDPNAQYFVGSHPHGTLIFQRMFWRSSLLDPHFPSPRIRMLGASVLFRIPIVREMTLFFGAVDASRSNCERLQEGLLGCCLSGWYR